MIAPETLPEAAPAAPHDPPRLLRRREVERLRSVEALHREAEAVLAAAREEARRLQAEMVEAARARTFAQASRAAAQVIAEAEGRAERRLADLEPMVARLVSQLVTQVIGEVDRAEAVEHATATALVRLRDHRRARIVAAPDVVDAVRAAVARIGAGEGAEVLEVQADERLAPGRTVLSSDGGHAEIGLADLVSQALRPFGDNGEAGAAPGGSGEATR